jgi:hypothetical protein
VAFSHKNPDTTILDIVIAFVSSDFLIVDCNDLGIIIEKQKTTF